MNEAIQNWEKLDANRGQSSSSDCCFGENLSRHHYLDLRCGQVTCSGLNGFLWVKNFVFKLNSYSNDNKY